MKNLFMLLIFANVSAFAGTKALNCKKNSWSAQPALAVSQLYSDKIEKNQSACLNACAKVTHEVCGEYVENNYNEMIIGGNDISKAVEDKFRNGCTVYIKRFSSGELCECCKTGIFYE